MALTKAKLLELIENGDIPSGGGGSASNGLPQGGTAGQYLKKNSATDFDAGWGDKPAYNAQDVGALPITGGTLTGDLEMAAGALILGKGGRKVNNSDDVTNMNLLLYEWYFSRPTHTNIPPDSTYYYVHTVLYPNAANDTRMQVAYGYLSNTTYFRSCYRGTWTAWRAL